VKLWTYALRVKAAPEEQGTERGDGATAEALDEQDTPELQEPSSSEDDEQFEEGSEEDVFILEDWEEGEEPPLEPEETLNAMRIEGEGDENGESCHIAAVRPIWEEEVPPFRARAHKMEVVHPILKREARQCLALWIELDGKPVYALFDTESTTDIVTPSFTRVMGLNSF
jgi:hypothetical protein